MITRRFFLKSSLVGGAALALPGTVSSLISTRTWSALAEPLLEVAAGETLIKPYVVRRLGNVRVGLFGLGISPDNLITPENFKGVKYLDPVQMSRGVVRLLREQEKCQLVVGMSHLGYYANPKNREIGDTQVAAQVNGIDFIASGHTHTFMEKHVLQKNPDGKDTIIFQVGKSGIYVGRIDFKLKNGKVVAAAGRLLDLRDESLA